MQRNTDEGGSGDKSAYRQLNLALQRSVLNVCSEYVNYEKQVLIKATFVICADENETVVLGIEELLKYDIQVSRKKDGDRRSSRRDDSPIIVSQGRKRTADGREGEARKKNHVDGHVTGSRPEQLSRRQDSIDVDADCIEIADDDDHAARANSRMQRRDTNQFSTSPGHRAVPMANTPLTPRRLLQPHGQQQNRNMPQFVDTVSPGAPQRPRNRRVTFGGVGAIRPTGPGSVQQIRMRNLGQPINAINQGMPGANNPDVNVMASRPPLTGQPTFRHSAQNINAGSRAVSGNMYNHHALGQSNRSYAAAQQHQQQQQQMQHQLQQQQQQHLQQQQQLHQQQQLQQLQQQQPQQQFGRSTVQPVSNDSQIAQGGLPYQHMAVPPSENNVSGHAGVTFSTGQVTFQNAVQTVDTTNQAVSGNVQYDQVVTTPPESSATGQTNVSFSAQQVQFANTIQPGNTQNITVNNSNQSTVGITSTEQLQVENTAEPVNPSSINGVASPPVLTSVSTNPTISGNLQSQNGQFYVMPQLQITDVVSLREPSDGTNVVAGDGVEPTATSCVTSVAQDTGSSSCQTTLIPELRECTIALVRDSTNGNIVGHVPLSNIDSADVDQSAVDNIQYQQSESNASDNTSDQPPATPDAAPSSVSSDAQMSDASASQDQSEPSPGTGRPKRSTRNSKTAANAKLTSLQHQSLEEELEGGSGASEEHGGRKWPCEICSKAFRSQSGLKVHRLLHTDYRPYKCECSRGFTTRSHYKSHLKNCPKATPSATTALSPDP